MTNLSEHLAAEFDLFIQRFMERMQAVAHGGADIGTAEREIDAFRRVLTETSSTVQNDVNELMLYVPMTRKKIVDLAKYVKKYAVKNFTP